MCNKKTGVLAREPVGIQPFRVKFALKPFSCGQVPLSTSTILAYNNRYKNGFLLHLTHKIEIIQLI